MSNKLDNSLKELFDRYFKHLKFDKKLLKQFTIFRINWLNKNSDHIEFFSNPLLGVNNIIFSQLDEETIFSDIIKIDKTKLKNDLHNLSVIDTNRIVTSNVFYHTMIYIMHRFTLSKDIGSDRDRAIKEIYYLFAYKALSSLLNWYFKYPVEKDIAITVYENLSSRFILKQVNNWQEFLDYRAKDFLKGGLHYDKLKTYKVNDVLYMISDTQGRLRDTVKNMYSVLIDVKENGEIIHSTNLEEKIEDSDGIKDITDRPDLYTNFIKDIVGKRNDFIKEDLIKVVYDFLPNLEPKVLKQTLEFITEHSMEKKYHIHTILDKAIKESINYLSIKGIRGDLKNNLPTIIKLIRGYWVSSKVTSKDVKETKRNLQIIVKKATNKKTGWILVTGALGVILYVFLRAIAKNTYK